MMSSLNKSKLHRKMPFVIAALAVLAAIFLFPLFFMGKQFSFDGQELQSVKFALNSSVLTCLTKAPPDYGIESNGLIYYLLYHYHILLDGKLFDTAAAIIKQVDSNCVDGSTVFTDKDIVWLRLFSLFFYWLSAIIVFLIGQKLAGRMVGLLAAFFYAVSGTLLTVSSFCRFYEAGVFFSCLSSYFLLRLMESKNQKWWFIAYALTMTMSIASLMCSAFLLVFHGLYWIYAKRPIKHYIYLAVLSGIFFLLLWKLDPVALSRKGFYLAVNTDFIVKSILWIFGLDCDPRLYYGALPWNSPLVMLLKASVVLLFIACVFILAYVAVRRKWYDSPGKLASFSNSKQYRLIVFASLWSVMPLAIMMVLSFFFTNIINKYNISFICPGCALLAGVAACHAQRFLRWAFLALILAGSPLYLPATIHDDLKCSYRFIPFLKEHMRENDIVVSRGLMLNV
ncbi:MAG: glycosyltransferase family 39 protein, partial [bacterium]|nr:glycosyltransferase family 39 protein [bacterium]